VPLACAARVVAPVSRESLTTYLNDHLAGSVAAVELLGHMIRLQQGRTWERALTEIRAEVEEDQMVLERHLHEVGGKESRSRQVVAWITEKLGRAKLKLDDSGNGELQMLESLEALALGIQGKAALWRALASAEGPGKRLDYSRLEQRAVNQFQRVEALRLDAARAALSTEEHHG
jgi:hypothetical protein